MKRGRVSRALVVLSCGLFYAGCATLRPLPITGTLPILEDDEGILLIHIVTDVPLEAVVISGGRVLQDVPSGDTVSFVAATAGTYKWHRIVRRMYGEKYAWDMNRPGEILTFSVEPGVINYPGTLVVSQPLLETGVLSFRIDVWLAGMIVNRSAKTLLTLEREQPALLRAFPLRYAGSSRDDFLALYLEAREKRPLSDGSGSTSH